MIEIKKNFYVKTLSEVKHKHKKDIMSDLGILQNIKKYTLNENIINSSNNLYDKILRNDKLTDKDINDFYDLYYLNYLKNYFPLINYNTIDNILYEYNFLLKGEWKNH